VLLQRDGAARCGGVRASEKDGTAMKMWSVVGAFALALAVMLGAFGAHALRERLDAYSMGIYEKAVFYHFIHALGILIVSMRMRSDWVCGLLCAGIVLFSGSLYLLAVTGVRTWGAVTPFGGLAFIVGWVWLGVAMLRE
jgi:uncharacterized membrane protein YgdD (TMEM256/DUF423 family)